ncbi:MAG: GMC family oxidoreductase [Candidatus Dadabacteria bacterium]|nr:MAG: GMC family oxidoreductase [Candidatus Dadabacteria bacterium]
MGFVQTVEDLVIGSGFAGSVIAARLAQAGRQVVVLERGPWWRTDTVGSQSGAAERQRAFPRGRQAARLLRSIEWRARTGLGAHRLVHADGLFDVHRSPHLAVFCGSGVGGGSHVYTNMLVEPRDAFFDAFPGVLQDRAYWKDLFARVRAVLRPQPWPDALPRWRHWNDRFERPDLALIGPDAARDVVNAAGVVQQPCEGCGECIIGCTYGAKTTLDLTYIQMALQAGAVVEALIDVRAIRSVDGGYEVTARDQQTGRQRIWRARRVFVCAGALNTMRLLLRARERGDLSRLPAQLGRRVGANGDVLGLLSTAPVQDDAPGPSIGGIFPRTDDRYLIAEGVIPWPRSGRISRGLLERFSLLLGMGDDGLPGRAVWRGGGLTIAYQRSDAGELYSAIEARMQEFAHAARSRLRWINVPSMRSRGASRATVHLMGGCTVSDAPNSGVVNASGEVYGHPGLFVADGSIFPAAPGTPPSLAIAAFAEHVAAAAA